jgi:ATP-dependent DNA helicase PIF1
VNGSVGKVVGFMTTLKAKACGIKIGLAEMPQKSVRLQSYNKKAGPLLGPDVIPERILKSEKMWPLVRFKTCSYYGDSIDVLCVPNTFEVNNADGGVEVTREQVSTITSSR